MKNLRSAIIARKLRVHQILQTFCYLFVPFFLIFTMWNCSTDMVSKIEENSIESWAKTYYDQEENIDHYSASDFCEMALAGFFENEISLMTRPTDSIYFYSSIYTDSYTDRDLVVIANELKERLSPYYASREILGNNVEIFQFKDKLLVLSILQERREVSIVQRDNNCGYTEDHPFNEGQTTCEDNVHMAEALSRKFFNGQSEGCYLDDIPESPPAPSWNYVYMYRNVPNPASNQYLFTESCGDIQTCLDRIQGGNINMMSPIFCNYNPNLPYCAYLDVPGSPNQQRIYSRDYNDDSCVSSDMMDQYQKWLAEMAEDIRDHNLYGLSSDWVPHLSVIRNVNNSTIKTHIITIEYITFGYNPKNGPGIGGV